MARNLVSQSGAVPGFLPSSCAWHFPNEFSGPAVTVGIPGLGKIGLGNAAHGVCGGMVFAARDYFEAGRAIPSDTTPPAQGTPLFGFVTARLIDSFDIPRGVLKYLSWMATPDHDTHTWLGVDKGVQSLTIKQEWPAIKAALDGGHPCPLGLVTVASTRPADLGDNHVVLAYAYDLTDGGGLTVHVYDPNTPGGDAVAMTLDIENPAQPTPIAHNINISRPVRGFFALRYAKHDPPA